MIWLSCLDTSLFYHQGTYRKEYFLCSALAVHHGRYGSSVGTVVRYGLSKPNNQDILCGTVPTCVSEAGLHCPQGQLVTVHCITFLTESGDLGTEWLLSELQMKLWFRKEMFLYFPDGILPPYPPYHCTTILLTTSWPHFTFTVQMSFLWNGLWDWLLCIFGKCIQYWMYSAVIFIL